MFMIKIKGKELSFLHKCITAQNGHSQIPSYPEIAIVIFQILVINEKNNFLLSR